MIRPQVYDAVLKYHCGALRLSPAARFFASYIDPKTGKNAADAAGRGIWKFGDRVEEFQRLWKRRKTNGCLGRGRGM